MVIASTHTQSKLGEDVSSIRVGDATVEAASSARNIGAIVDNKLDMVEFISRITSTCYYHLRNISSIRKNLTSGATTTLLQAFVVSKLDNLNSLIYGVPDKLQLIQNLSA